MDIPRRESFKSWFKEVGFLYLAVILIVALVFFFRDLKTDSPSFIQNSANTQTEGPVYTEGN